MFEQIITVRSWESGDFKMFINLPLLPEMGIRKLRKLFRLMCQSPELNAAALETLSQWLEDYAQGAKDHWVRSSARYELEYQTPPEGHSKARREEAKRVRANNNALTCDLKKAKTVYEKAVKMQKYFTEERNF